MNGFSSGNFHSRFHDDYRGVIFLEILINKIEQTIGVL